MNEITEFFSSRGAYFPSLLRLVIAGCPVEMRPIWSSESVLGFVYTVDGN